MFSIGDMIYYPRHGAGIIEGIEEKEVLGEKCKYYVIRIALGDMKVMVPIGKTEFHGIRNITSRDRIDDIYNILSGETSCMCKNWSKRYRENEAIIRKGDIFEISELVKNLTVADRGKKLSTGEKRMLENVRQLLVSELMLMLDEPYEKIEEKILGIIKQ
ncbi:MAG TPA: CarD family transcriptional regulator [Bacillota bacterium]|jgi:CarD family transcriptional regulator|nr:CarD family transcriptional regulator [Bacillota bacterium]HRS20608.1 CarD family transcriptional regulator [Clostridia bacterium]HQE66881.1 CarD family transcriptional regulator [Bacillota bacterium]HQI15972.1 CarD family transcriptional regulator [Bacillota bacterium]HQJ37320.1 CarD family transcriptional regulator [Bacillota bacterium]